MDYIQSFSIKPLCSNRYDVDVDTMVKSATLCGTLSFVLLNNINIHPILHTDKSSFSFFSHLDWKDIVCDLDNVDDADGVCYGAYRLEALSNSPIGSCHIDSDVMIYDANKLKPLEDFSLPYKIITLSRNFIPPESVVCPNPVLYIDDIIPLRPFFSTKDFSLEGELGYDVGILQFRDETEFSKFKNLYKESVQIYENSVLPNYRKFNTLFSPEHVFTDKFLFETTSNVLCLNDIIPLDDNKKIKEMKKGIRHYTKYSKFKEKYINEIENTLKNLNTEIYYNTIEKIDENTKMVKEKLIVEQ